MGKGKDDTPPAAPPATFAETYGSDEPLTVDANQLKRRLQRYEHERPDIMAELRAGGATEQQINAAVTKRMSAELDQIKPNQPGNTRAPEPPLADVIDLGRLPLGTPTHTAEPPDLTEPLEALAVDPEIAKVFSLAVGAVRSRAAVLCSVLARMSAGAPTGCHLPGPPSPAPLNLFCVLVSPSGSGKSSAARVASNALDGFEDLATLAPSSGEAVIDAYSERVTYEDLQGKQRAEWRLKQDTDRGLLVAIDEADQLTAVTTRAGNNVAPLLRSAWSGEMLRADTTRRAVNQLAPRPPVPAMTYRIGAVIAGTLESAGDLLDSHGGTAERMLVISAVDPGTAELVRTGAHSRRTPVTLTPWTARGLIDVNETTAADVHTNLLRQVEGNPEAIAGHAVAIRLRIAALLGWLRNHPGRLDYDDWELAGHVMTIHNASRGYVAAAAAAKRRNQTHSAAVGRGLSDITTAETKLDRADQLVKSCAKTYHARLADGDPEPDAMKAAISGQRAAQWKAATGYTDSARAGMRTAIQDLLNDR